MKQHLHLTGEAYRKYGAVRIHAEAQHALTQSFLCGAATVAFIVGIGALCGVLS